MFSFAGVYKKKSRRFSEKLQRAAFELRFTLYWSINYHNHKKRENCLKTPAVLLIFSVELKISGVAVQSINQNGEKLSLLCGMLSENGFEAVLATFCCYDHGAKASEAVQKIAQKIARDQNEYRKCSSYVIIC